MVFTISLSYYYNKSFKLIKYKYSIKFNTLSSWDVLGLGYDKYSIFESLVKKNIIENLEKFGPLISWNINNDNEVYFLDFESGKKININNLFNDVSNDFKDEILISLDRKIDNLINEAKLLEKNISNQLNYFYQKKTYLDEYSSNVKNEKDKGKYSSEYFEKKFYDFENEYKELRLNILKLEYALKSLEETNNNEEELIKWAIANNLDSGKGISKSYEEFFDYFTVKPNYEKLKNSSKPLITSLSNWKESDNKFSNLEIFIMGLLFGILLSFIIIFIKSEYFRKSIFYPR